MKLRLLLPALAACCLFPLSSFAATVPAPAAPALTDLVDDQTAFALVVPDAPALVRGWDASQFARTWNDEQVVKFFGPLRTQLKIDTWDDQAKAATGKTLRELLALAKGGAIVAVPASALGDLAGGKDPEDPAFFVAVELGDNAAVVEKLAADAAAKADDLHVDTTKYAGVMVHANLPPPPKDGAKPGTPVVTAMCQGIWLLSPNKDRVCAAIDAIQKGGLPNALGRSENFLRVQKRAGASHLLGYVDLQALYTVLDAALQKSTDGQEGGPYNPKTILATLGFDALRDAYVTMFFGDAEVRLTSGLDYSEEKGLVRLLAYGPAAAPRPAWVPAKWIGVGAGTFDSRAAYAALEQLLADASPPASSFVQAQLTQLNQQLGLDLKRDLIGSLGGEVVSGYALPPGASPDKAPALTAMDQVFAVSLENPESFANSLEALKGLMGPQADKILVKRDYLGSTLYSFTPPPEAKGARGYTYTVANHLFLLGIGSPATVESVLQAMDGKHDSFWDRKEIKAALADVPEAACAVQVNDLHVLVGSVFGMLTQLPIPPIGPVAEGGTPGAFFDAAAVPDAEHIARYWGLASSYLLKDSHSIFSVVRIANPAP